MMKLKSLSLMTGTTAIMLLLGVPSWAAEQPGLGIANNDSVYVDGNSLKIVPGKGKGDASALITKLDAHAVGAGMIVFRSGDKLYMADTPSPVNQTDSGTDRYGFGGYAAWAGSQRAREPGLRSELAMSCSFASACGIHGHDHARAWSSKLPIADLKSFWGLLGCSCFAF